MAELLGAVASGITIAALFKTCVAAFDLFQHAKNQDAEFHKLTIRFNIEKCRLWLWGEAMGLDKDLPAGQPRPLDDSPFKTLIRDTLQAIVDTFNDTQKMRSRYGCRMIQDQPEHGLLTEADCRDHASTFVAAVTDFGYAAREKVQLISDKTRWLIHDRKKFPDLIQEAKGLVDGLQEITKALSSASSQEQLIIRSIQHLKDTETLQLVTQATQEYYPKLSDAASNRIEVLTMATDDREAVESWSAQLEPTSDISSADLESLTITELKDRLIATEARLMHAGSSIFNTTDRTHFTPLCGGLGTIESYTPNYSYDAARAAFCGRSSIFSHHDHHYGEDGDAGGDG